MTNKYLEKIAEKNQEPRERISPNRSALGAAVSGALGYAGGGLIGEALSDAGHHGESSALKRLGGRAAGSKFGAAAGILSSLEAVHHHNEKSDLEKRIHQKTAGLKL